MRKQDQAAPCCVRLFVAGHVPPVAVDWPAPPAAVDWPAPPAAAGATRLDSVREVTWDAAL